MICDEARILLAAFLDDELATGDCAAVAAHLAGCPDCRSEQEQHVALRSIIRGADLYAQPPRLLAGKVRRAVRAEATHDFRRTFALAAAVILSVAALAGASWHWLGTRPEQLIARDVVASHIRSFQAGHLIDVVSSDRHTVKPWFQGKLDFAPPVPDLSAKGWLLAGGRLDYVGGRPVAALIYRRAAHPINVFVWPAPQPAGSAIDESAQDGYTVLHWISGGMTYWVVSDLNRAELLEFAHDLKN